LRFADELAEGPQRTSKFMLDSHKFEKESEIYHRYASCTNIFIDRGNGRIALTFHVKFEIDGHKHLRGRNLKNFTGLMDYIYRRIIKLDQERRYARHYSEFLAPFKRTSVEFNFYANEEALDGFLLEDVAADRKLTHL